MKNILITGGTGYIGIELTKKLLKEGYKVRILDLLMYQDDNILSHPNLQLIKLDIRDLNKVDSFMKGMDTLIHLACVSNDPGYELDPVVGKEINYDIFEPLVELAIKKGIKRMIYPSSCSVYGKVKELVLTEDSPTNPLTDYAECKLKCENILLKYSSENFFTTILRPATVCGYSDRQRLDLTVNHLTNQIYHFPEVKLEGINRVRPSLNIKDMVRAYITLIKSEKREYSGEIYNLAYESYSIKEIAARISIALKKKITFSSKETLDNRSYSISSLKIGNHYGFRPLYGIKDAAEEIAMAIKTGRLKNTFDSKRYYNKKVQKEYLFPVFNFNDATHS